MWHPSQPALPPWLFMSLLIGSLTKLSTSLLIMSALCWIVGGIPWPVVRHVYPRCAHSHNCEEICICNWFILSVGLHIGYHSSWHHIINLHKTPSLVKPLSSDCIYLALSSPWSILFTSARLSRWQTLHNSLVVASQHAFSISLVHNPNHMCLRHSLNSLVDLVWSFKYLPLPLHPYLTKL